MTKVRFLTTSAGAGGVIRPGDVVEVSESEAKLLIDCGYALGVEPAAKPKPEPKPKPETEERKPRAKKES